jgi:hypothetical protein
MADESYTGSLGDDTSLGGFDSQSLITGALVGATLGALLVHLLKGRRGSEEPPILVKGGGSLDYELLHGSIYWVQNGSKKILHLSGGTRNQAKYEIQLTVKKNHGGTEKTTCKEHKVEIHYEVQRRWVELKATGNHTTLVSHDDLEPESDPQILKHPMNIEEIHVGSHGDVIYRPGDGIFEELLLLDY